MNFNSVNCDQRQGAPLLLEELKIMWHRSSSVDYLKNRTRWRWNSKECADFECSQSSGKFSWRRQAKAAQLTCSSVVAQPDQRCFYVQSGSQRASGPNFPKSHNHDHPNKLCCLYVYYYVVEWFFFFNRSFSFLGLIIKNVLIRNLAGWARCGQLIFCFSL